MFEETSHCKLGIDRQPLNSVTPCCALPCTSPVAVTKLSFVDLSSY